MAGVFGLAGGEVKAGLGRAARLVLDTLYPPHCLACEAAVLEPGTLCGRCWAEAAFVTGLSCDKCAAPLPGDPAEAPILCDDCLRVARPWSHGRAALLYGGTGRQLVLALKYGDRHDIARPAGRWLARQAAPLCRADTLVVPVPLHRARLFHRRYNQSALLALALGRELDRPALPDLLLRTRCTGIQDGLSRAARFENQQGAIAPRPTRAKRIEGRHVLLVDDVMTSGATLAAAAEACFAAGADDVDVIVLARVLREE
ncbi:ComF family protein [Pararhodobacter sp.]|uniref:ComF family protein n=1 Tax=Pararhodobacter sp. TaxID=2127056 RepID=UPI002AFDDC36|nr:double zinc ribbon domain-containing protein [Pararhodobacter sp.]